MARRDARRDELYLRDIVDASEAITAFSPACPRRPSSAARPDSQRGPAETFHHRGGRRASQPRTAGRDYRCPLVRHHRSAQRRRPCLLQCPLAGHLDDRDRRRSAPAGPDGSDSAGALWRISDSGRASLTTSPVSAGAGGICLPPLLSSREFVFAFFVLSRPPTPQPVRFDTFSFLFFVFLREFVFAIFCCRTILYVPNSKYYVYYYTSLWVETARRLVVAVSS